jgi:hypothetical protein
MNQMEMP